MKPRMRAAFLVLLLLPTAQAGLAAGPDEDGRFELRFGFVRASAGEAALVLRVEREDAEGVLRASRELSGADLAEGPQELRVPFLPAEGAGRYSVTLLVDGEPVDAANFDVADASASASVVFDVPDAPTFVNLTGDEVNTPGKVKSPGEALVTRVQVSDANGLAELEGLLWAVGRAGATLDTGRVGLPRNGTSASVEIRYDRSPLAAGEHVLFLYALRDGATVAGTSRTFSIREVSPTFVSGSLRNATPDEERLETGHVVLADRNGPVGPAPLEARVYRGSARLEGTGFNATLGAPTRLADEGGAARWSYPIALRVPARAAPGAHRVSLYHGDTLLSALPFEVLPLPQLRGVSSSSGGGGLELAIEATGEGLVSARLSDGSGASTVVGSAFRGNATLVLAPPSRGSTLRWDVEIRAREGGPVLAARNGSWAAPADGPALRLAPVHVRPRLPASWAVDASGWDVGAANATFRFARWDGAPEASIVGEVEGDRVRVRAPGPLPAGRYHASLDLVWANGSAARVDWSFEAGPWVEVALDSPVVEGRTATLRVRNAGAMPIGRLAVETEPATNVTMWLRDEVRAPRAAPGRAVFGGLALSPGEAAEIRLDLDGGPARAGRQVVDVRVLARVELA